MKKSLILSALCIILTGNIIAQNTTETIVKDIRKKYQLINQQKLKYDIEEDEYNWEQAVIVPNLTEEQREHEYNEEGNYFSRKKSYFNANKVLQLVEIDDDIQRYQESYIMRRHREYYFWEKKLFFYFEQIEEIRVFKTEKASELRMYFNNGKLIRYLTKEIEGEEIETLSNLKNVEQDISDLKSLEWKDLIDPYEDITYCKYWYK
jgi:CMP-2-keto-3-deoxyoctulosonic acid synthetase